MSIEQDIAELKIRLDSLTAELNSQKMVDILELEGPLVTSASVPVDNPNKLPMPSRKDEFEASLKVALDGYEETIRRIQNNEPFLTKEEIQERKGNASRLPFSQFEMIQKDGGKIINDLPTKFEGGRVNYARGIAAQETNMLIQALNGLLDDGVINNGGYEEVSALVDYIHDWNVRICDKLLHRGFYPSSIRKSTTSPQNHEKALERLSNATVEEKERRGKYKPQVRMPVQEAVSALDGCELDSDGDHLWDAHKETTEAFKERHSISDEPINNKSLKVLLTEVDNEINQLVRETESMPEGK